MFEMGFAGGFLLLKFFQLQIQLFALDPQPLRVVIALAQRRHITAQLAQLFQLSGGIMPTGSQIPQGEGDAHGHAMGEVIGQLSVMLASKLNAAAPRVKRRARKRRSRSSCTSTVKSSSRFSLMASRRRARSFEAANGLKLAVDSPRTLSIPVALASAGEEITENRSNSNADGDSLIGMLMDGLVCCLGALNRLVAGAGTDLLATFQRGGETLAGFRHFFAGDVNGGGHQRLRVFGQLTHVIADCFCFFVHIFISACLCLSLLN